MQDGILVCDRLSDCRAVADIRLDERDRAAMVGKEPSHVSLRAGSRQVINDGDTPAGLREVGGSVDADEAGAACDEQSGHEAGGRPGSAETRSSYMSAGSPKTCGRPRRPGHRPLAQVWSGRPVCFGWRHMKPALSTSEAAR